MGWASFELRRKEGGRCLGADCRGDDCLGDDICDGTVDM